MGECKRRGNCCVAIRSFLLLTAVVLLSASVGVVADGNVTLESLTIFTTHEWFSQKPTVYFRCKNEKKVYLPDVIDKNHLYVFVGQESFQPLTELQATKCKRCGLYEQDKIVADETYSEWELCPGDFRGSAGRLVHDQKKEFNATFLCPQCALNSESVSEVENVKDHDKDTGMTLVFVAFVLLVLFGVGAIAYSKWRQKQREEQQARFVKLFEDDDDMETELGLKGGL